MSKKFYLKCKNCNFIIDSFNKWFKDNQRCCECGSNKADVIYSNTDKYNTFKSDILNDKYNDLSSIWKYFDILPLENKENIISSKEGSVSIDRWLFLENYAKNNGINCKVYAHRNDNNFATGTFKDLAGSVVASVLKENGIKDYVVASTGNVAVAYSRYLADADINLYAFIPHNSSKMQEAEISCFGQKVFRVKGDYQRAKELAKEFADKHKITLAAGNFDPMRIEAKKTMTYDWLRYLKKMPSVYIQGLSGGTGPIAIEKACKELYGDNYQEYVPRMLLVQTDKCAPMAAAWKEAKENNFPEGWMNKYPIYKNPETIIPTLSTGYPKTYPEIAKIVYSSNGDIITFDENASIDVARYVAFSSAVRIGPAAAIPVGGFIKAVHNGFIKDGDVVLINIGEGIRRSPGFMEKLIYNSSEVENIKDCNLFTRKDIEKNINQVIFEIKSRK